MTFHYKHLCVLTAASLMSSTGMASAGVLDNKTVRTHGDQIVRSAAFGTCVRTKWENGTDVCAPAEEKAPLERKPVNAIVTVLEEAERTVYFEFDSAALTPEAKFKLDRLSHKLKHADDIQGATIVGFADRIGSRDYNYQLSKERANAVRDYLATRGYLNTNVAEVRGLGEAKPITHCSEQLQRDRAIACLSADRRVEVEVDYTDTKRVIYRR